MTKLAMMMIVALGLQAAPALADEFSKPDVDRWRAYFEKVAVEGRGALDRRQARQERCELRSVPSQRGEHASGNVPQVSKAIWQGCSTLGNGQLVYAQSAGR